jgi:hypothetical protein
MPGTSEAHISEMRSCKCVTPCQLCKCNPTTPRMGAALTADMKRYRNELALLLPERIITSMVDCCDFLLIESDRLERGNYEC